MENIALFPGSFDPFTLGHEAIVRRALPLFNKIIIGVGTNSTKKYLFNARQRAQWIQQLFSDNPRISVLCYEGLTIDFCRNQKARWILRGLRSMADFEFERTVAQSNKSMYGDIETLFLLTDPEYTFIHSSVVREIIINGGDISSFVPPSISKEAKKLAAQ